MSFNRSPLKDLSNDATPTPKQGTKATNDDEDAATPPAGSAWMSADQFAFVEEDDDEVMFRVNESGNLRALESNETIEEKQAKVKAFRLSFAANHPPPLPSLEELKEASDVDKVVEDHKAAVQAVLSPQACPFSSSRQDSQDERAEKPKKPPPVLDDTVWEEIAFEVKRSSLQTGSPGAPAWTVASLDSLAQRINEHINGALSKEPEVEGDAASDESEYHSCEEEEEGVEGEEDMELTGAVCVPAGVLAQSPPLPEAPEEAAEGTPSTQPSGSPHSTAEAKAEPKQEDAESFVERASPGPPAAVQITCLRRAGCPCADCAEMTALCKTFASPPKQKEMENELEEEEQDVEEDVVTAGEEKVKEESETEVKEEDAKNEAEAVGEKEVEAKEEEGPGLTLEGEEEAVEADCQGLKEGGAGAVLEAEENTDAELAPAAAQVTCDEVVEEAEKVESMAVDAVQGAQDSAVQSAAYNTSSLAQPAPPPAVVQITCLRRAGCPCADCAEMTALCKTFATSPKQQKDEDLEEEEEEEEVKEHAEVGEELVKAEEKEQDVVEAAREKMESHVETDEEATEQQGAAGAVEAGDAACEGEQSGTEPEAVAVAGVGVGVGGDGQPLGEESLPSAAPAPTAVQITCLRRAGCTCADCAEMTALCKTFASPPKQKEVKEELDEEKGAGHEGSEGAGADGVAVKEEEGEEGSGEMSPEQDASAIEGSATDATARVEEEQEMEEGTGVRASEEEQSTPNEEQEEAQDRNVKDVEDSVHAAAEREIEEATPSCVAEEAEETVALPTILPAPASVVVQITCLRRAGCPCADCAEMTALCKTFATSPKQKAEQLEEEDEVKEEMMAVEEEEKKMKEVEEAEVKEAEEAEMKEVEEAEMKEKQEAEVKEEETEEVQARETAEGDEKEMETKEKEGEAEQGAREVQAPAPALSQVTCGEQGKDEAAPSAAVVQVTCLRRAGCTCADCAEMTALCATVSTKPKMEEEKEEAPREEEEAAGVVAEEGQGQEEVAACEDDASTALVVPSQPEEEEEVESMEEEREEAVAGAQDGAACNTAQSAAYNTSSPAQPPSAPGVVQITCLRRAGCTCADCAEMTALCAPVSTKPNMEEDAAPSEEEAEGVVAEKEQEQQDVAVCEEDASAVPSQPEEKVESMGEDEEAVAGEPDGASAPQATADAPVPVKAAPTAAPAQITCGEQGKDEAAPSAAVVQVTCLRRAGCTCADCAEMTALCAPVSKPTKLSQLEVEGEGGGVGGGRLSMGAANAAALRELMGEELEGGDALDDLGDIDALEEDQAGQAGGEQAGDQGAVTAAVAGASTEGGAGAGGGRYTLEDVERIAAFQTEALRARLEREKACLEQRVAEAEARAAAASAGEEKARLEAAMAAAEATVDELARVAGEEKAGRARADKELAETKTYADELEAAFNELHGRYTKLKEYYAAADSKNLELSRSLLDANALLKTNQTLLADKDARLRELEGQVAGAAAERAEAVAGAEGRAREAEGRRAEQESAALQLSVKAQLAAQEAVEARGKCEQWKLACAAAQQQLHTASAELAALKTNPPTPTDAEVRVVKGQLQKAEVEKAALKGELASKAAENAQLSAMCDELLQTLEKSK